MSRWFRHYAGMMRDDKLVRVALRSKQAIERVTWIWGAILESAAEIDDHGRFDLDPAEVAYFLRADEDDVAAVLAALGDAGRVADDVVVKWGDRQFSSDKSNARVAAYRERKRAQRGDSNGTKRERNVPVTLPDRDGIAPETETETYTHIPEATASGQASPPNPSAADLTKTIFDSGVTILKATGHNDRSARSIIGRWRKTYSASIVLCALSRCQAVQPSDPVEWMPRALHIEQQRAAGENPQAPQRPSRPSVRDIGMRLAAESTQNEEKRIAIGGR